MALVKIQDERDKIRDYFPALIASHLFNSVSEGQRFTAEDVLGFRYRSKDVLSTPTVDPDRGAPGLEWAREGWIANRG